MSDLRFFKRWFNASIQASKDSYAIGAGGASRVQEAKRLRKGTILEQQSATLETVAQLERSRDSILAFGRRVTAATIALGLSYLVSAAVPFMWTHMSYVTPAQSIFYTALSYPVVQVYRKDKKGGLLRIIAARIRSLGQRGSFSKFATSSVDDRFSGAELSRLSNVLQEI
uniref:Uncharacterized protein n=1 Tax=Chrysotila carterae TaxID=13221 RepID=A0A7S4ET34_CHRCT